jgi:SAM-dependent methyltransferase
MLTPADVLAQRSDDRAWTKWRSAMQGLAKYRDAARKKPGSSDGTSEHELRTMLQQVIAARADTAGATPSEKLSESTARSDKTAPALAPTLLDIGCKDGRMAGLLPSHWSYLGVDPAPVPPTVSPEPLLRGALLTGLAESLPVADRSVDVILCHSSFDYFVDAAKSLTEMHRVLKASGALLLVVSVVSTEVAHARGAANRAQRLFGALRASRSLTLKASTELMAEALVAERAHTHYYTRAQVMALLGVKFNLTRVLEVPQSSSKILYIHATKRQRRALNVL